MLNKASIELDGVSFKVQAGITVKRALELRGYKVSKYPDPASLFTPCETGGCWSCAVEVDGQPQRACLTIVRDGLSIKTVLPDDYVPRRIVTGFRGHQVGGVGTPWWLKSASGYIETACFAAGCNFRCPQCQNWDITYQSQGKLLSPREAAERMTEARYKFRVDRMAISGGESTLNRAWLLEYARELNKLNSDANARIHVDTNGSILTKDYIDELVEAGVTDVGPDLKGFNLESFMRITGMEDRDLAERYQRTAWEAVRYLIEEYKDRVFTGVGIPYNRDLISVQEVEMMGEKLSKIDPELQVCVLDYRPEFKKQDLVRPSYDEMVEIHTVLSGKGLKTVVCQTKYGHIGPRPDMA
ncbi:MAG: radical SAM protein [Deltaproteobacteria bacterium]|nr:radical SAM protein [Deltaproteobacteria bacterium]